jgi:predicted molibdopterin-dependent oxidoreductase YjgC
VLTLRLDETRVCVREGATVLAALHESFFAAREQGKVRAPLCGMGVCHECLLEIDGVLRLACATLARENMEVRRVR